MFYKKKLSIFALLGLITLCSSTILPKQEDESTMNRTWKSAQSIFDFTAYQATKKSKDSKQRFLDGEYDSASDSYQKLNTDRKFQVGIGSATSQTNHTENTVRPDFLAMLLQKASQKAKNPAQWLKDHWGYVTQALPDVSCKSCNAQIQMHTLNKDKHNKIVDSIVSIIAANRNAHSIALTECPKCHSPNLAQSPKAINVATESHTHHMAAQLKRLGSFDQVAAQTYPAYRLSIELADILKSGTDQVDNHKLRKQAERLQELRNPLTFFHHYANPQCKPYLFNNPKDPAWFADRCADVVRACPGLTHVCPISQIMGFGLQVARGGLPPFEAPSKQYLDNIVEAQVLAGRAMKKVNPNIQVLVSHQWKPMKPKHNMLDPRYGLEKLISSIADHMYNQKFVKLLKPHIDEIDGIALSVYPSLYFDMWKAESDNCSGKLDPAAALEAIEKTAEAFPGKPIYIVETGCNHPDQAVKKKFVDMTLHACVLARNKGIDVRTCYFWGHSNKSYMEWNKADGACNFGAFEGSDPESINEYGKYLETVTKL